MILRERDGERIGDGAGGLDHRPERRAGLGTLGPGKRTEDGEIVRNGDLGQQDAVRRRRQDGGEIGLALAIGERIDPHHEFGAVVASRHGEQRYHPLARRRLHLRRDRILEVEDHDIGGEARQLGQRPLVDAGNIEHRTTGAAGRHGITSWKRGPVQARGLTVGSAPSQRG